MSNAVIDKLLSRFVVTNEKVRDMEDRVFIWRNNLSKGYITVWCAPANGGKSAIARWAAAEIASKGFDVYYFHEDAGASELKNLQEEAASNNYSLMNTCLAGSSPAEVLAAFKEMAASEADLSNAVFFFDTLKKFIDVMHKGFMTEVGKLFRSLTIRGASIVLLHHTTKRPNNDGTLIFDGVGDLRNDIDELHYIHALPSKDGESITFTITPDKNRSLASRVSLIYNKQTRELTPTDASIDVADAVQISRMHERDAGIKAAVRNELRNGPQPITSLALRVQESSGANEKRIRDVIKRWSQTGMCPSQPEWFEQRTSKNNTLLISLTPPDTNNTFQTDRTIQTNKNLPMQ